MSPGTAPRELPLMIAAQIESASKRVEDGLNILGGSIGLSIYGDLMKIKHQALRAIELKREFAAAQKDAERYRCWQERSSPTLLLGGQVKVSIYFDKWTSDGTPDSYKKCLDSNLDSMMKEGKS